MKVKKDFKKIKELPFKPIKKSLSVSINEEAFKKLKLLASSAKLKSWEMLDRILVDNIDYLIKENLKKTDSAFQEKKRYKRAINIKQLNCYVSIGGWEKLDILSKLNGKSKARIVQELLLEHHPITELTERRRKIKRDERELKHFDGAFLNKLYVSVDGFIKHIKNIPRKKWDAAELKEYDLLKPYEDARLKAINNVIPEIK